MKNTCVITSTLEDDDKIIRFLAREAKTKYETVKILALGNDSDVFVLQERYENTLTLNEIKPDFNADRVIITSLSAFFELDSYVLKFADVTLWFDPSVSAEFAVTELTNCTCASSLATRIPNAIASTTDAGANDWLHYSNVAIPSIAPKTSCSYELDTIEPLIEKGKKTRFLIDGSAQASNHYMVDAFIALQERSDVEVWCLFDGELKSWMRPDFLIAGVSREDLAIYTESVDAVILVGDAPKDTQFVDYFNLKKFPFVLDETASEKLESFIEPNLIASMSGPAGSAKIIDYLATNSNEIAEYNELVEHADVSDCVFSFSQLEDVRDESHLLIDYFSSLTSGFIRANYLEARYGDKDGSELHRNAKLNAKILEEVPAKNQEKIRVSGWTLNVDSDDVGIPVLFSGNDKLPCLMRRHHRPDVLEHFNKTGIENVGFVGKFYRDADENESPLTYAVTNGLDGYATFNTMLENLDISVEVELMNANGFELNTGPKGCIETLKRSSVLRFDLTGVTRSFDEYSFRIKHNGAYLNLDEIDVSIIVAGDVKHKDVLKEGFSFKSISAFGDISSVSIIVDLGDMASDFAEFSCVVSHDDNEEILSERVADINSTDSFDVDNEHVDKQEYGIEIVDIFEDDSIQQERVA